jgi:hypothetical protein
VLETSYDVDEGALYESAEYESINDEGNAIERKGNLNLRRNKLGNEFCTIDSLLYIAYIRRFYSKVQTYERQCKYPV